MQRKFKAVTAMEGQGNENTVTKLCSLTDSHRLHQYLHLSTSITSPAQLHVAPRSFATHPCGGASG